MKKKYIINLFFILIAVFLFFFVEQIINNANFEIKFDDSFRKKIEKEKPDIILIGNSVLGSNIHRSQLQKELYYFLGKKIRVSLISIGGMQSAWSYLIMKNQISKSNIKDIPVGFVFHDERITNPNIRVKDELLLKKTATNYEPVFWKKLKENSIYYHKGFPHIFNDKITTKKNIISLYGNFIFQQILNKNKFRKTINLVFKRQNFKTGGSSGEKRKKTRKKIQSQKDFENQIVNPSFLNEILKFNNDFHVFFISSSLSPAPKHQPKNPNLQEPYASDRNLYFSFLNKYLKKNNSFLINLNKRKEIKDKKFFKDVGHLLPLGKQLNSKILAQEIILSGILGEPKEIKNIYFDKYIYEDADNGYIDQWSVIKGTIDTIYDKKRNNRVLFFKTAGEYQMQINAKNLFIISWDMNFTDNILFYIRIKTNSNKINYIIYNNSDKPCELKKQNIVCGIGKDILGKWYNVKRNLNNDLQYISPKEVVEKIISFTVNTEKKGKLDNIFLFKEKNK